MMPWQGKSVKENPTGRVTTKLRLAGRVGPMKQEWERVPGAEAGTGKSSRGGSFSRKDRWWNKAGGSNQRSRLPKVMREKDVR